jgi:hypothetical protein
VIATPEDAARIEDIWRVADVMRAQEDALFSTLTEWDKRSA